MENIFIEIVKQINPIQTVILGLIAFYFYNRLDYKITKLDEKFDNEIKDLKQETKSINSRIDKLYDLILDVYKTLSKKNVA